jgi:DNA polymerase-1
MQQSQKLNSEDRYVFDIETNGLDPTCVHVVVVEDRVCTKSAELSDYVRTHDGMYYAHNGIGFDWPVLSRLWDCDWDRNKLRDTMVLSRLANPSRDGGHSLGNWGKLLNHPKVEHDDWSTYTPAMLHRCEEDVALTKDVLRALDGELEGFSEQSIELEHAVAWIIEKQVRNGWLLDQEAVFMLLAELKEKKLELEKQVHKRFRPQYVFEKLITPKINKDGSTSKVGLKYLGEDCLNIVGGPHSRIDYVEFNLGSRPQIAEYLQSFGWKPLNYTATTPKGGGNNPIVSEEELRWVKGIPEASLIADYLTVKQRIAMAQGWLDKVRPTGRVHGYVNSNGAVTGRMTHEKPNVAQVTASGKIYGSEMRSCWIVPQGYKLVGMDAKGLELRMLAHYMNDAGYTEDVAHGDPHTRNQQAAGLTTRDEAKTFIYAFLYGAGDNKIGTIVGGGRREGRALKAKFLRGLPALKTLKDRVEVASRRGYLVGLDGRRIAVRSPHAALNSLLQGAGAVVMKQALVNLDRMARAQGLDFKFVGNIHDEIQSEVREDQAERFGKLAAYAVVQAGKDLKMRCPLAGDYKVGINWKETH